MFLILIYGSVTEHSGIWFSDRALRYIVQKQNVQVYGSATGCPDEICGSAQHQETQLSGSSMGHPDVWFSSMVSR